MGVLLSAPKQDNLRHILTIPLNPIRNRFIVIIFVFFRFIRLLVIFRIHFHNSRDPFGKQNRTIRVWLRRDTGQYWPSICQYMPSGCTSVDYHPDGRLLYVGQDNGTITQYTLANDCNSLTMVRDYLAHQARVTGVSYTPQGSWILSCGRDKLFSFHSTETTRRLGGYTFDSMCTSLQ